MSSKPAWDNQSDPYGHMRAGEEAPEHGVPTEINGCAVVAFQFDYSETEGVGTTATILVKDPRESKAKAPFVVARWNLGDSEWENGTYDLSYAKSAVLFVHKSLQQVALSVGTPPLDHARDGWVFGTLACKKCDPGVGHNAMEEN